MALVGSLGPVNARKDTHCRPGTLLVGRIYTAHASYLAETVRVCSGVQLDQQTYSCWMCWEDYEPYRTRLDRVLYCPFYRRHCRRALSPEQALLFPRWDETHCAVDCFHASRPRASEQRRRCLNVHGSCCDAGHVPARAQEGSRSVDGGQCSWREGRDSEAVEREGDSRRELGQSRNDTLPLD